MLGLTKEGIEDIFSDHAPTPDQIPKYNAIREGAKVFAQIVMDNTPGSADQTVAIRKVREAAMIANASIALGGKY